MDSRRKRGANYTPQEVEKLLELVEQHHVPIEDKRTGGVFLKQKKEAWKAVCAAYNAVATSGPRTVEQLRVFYDNKKQKLRRVLIEHNKSEQQKSTDSEQATNDHTPLLPLRKVYRCPTVTDQELRIFDRVKNPVTPPPSSDSTYFADQTHETEDIVVEVQPPVGKEDDARKEGRLKPEVVVEIEQLRNEDDSRKEDGTESDKSNPVIKKEVLELIECDTRLDKDKVVTPPKRNLKKNYKELYFRRKCHNAYLERKRLCQEMQLRQIEHEMVVKEHMMRIQFMRDEHDRKMNGFQYQNQNQNQNQNHLLSYLLHI